jgi:hypothetical protein
VGNDKTIFKTVSIDTLFQDKLVLELARMEIKFGLQANDSRFGYYDLKIKEK